VLRFLLLLAVLAATVVLAPAAAAQDVCPSQVDPRERCDDAASACVATSGFKSV
jgi:hypothetical protein